MKTFLIVFTIIFGVMIITNPTEQMHKDAVKKIVQKGFSENLINEQSLKGDNAIDNLGKSLGGLFGALFIEKFIDNTIERENYLIFSFTKFKYQSEKKDIGIGLFNNVFISNRISELFNKHKTEDQAQSHQKTTQEYIDEGDPVVLCLKPVKKDFIFIYKNKENGVSKEFTTQEISTPNAEINIYPEKWKYVDRKEIVSSEALYKHKSGATSLSKEVYNIPY